MTDAYSSNAAASSSSLDKTTFAIWPAGLRALFDGEALASKIGFTASLLTVDATSGHVRTSLLGIGELYAPDARTLYVALWPTSRAAAVLGASGRAAMSFVHEAAFYQVQLQFRSLARIADDDSGLTYFAGTIETGEAQRVPYARLTSGITFDLGDDGDAVIERWSKQIEMLRRAVD